MITAKINVLAIDKSRLFKGAKGTYLDLVLIETKDNQYGDDYMVVQGVTKEERDKGIRGAILGNAKIRGQQSPATRPQETPRQAASEDLDDDIAF